MLLQLVDNNCKDLCIENKICLYCEISYTSPQNFNINFSQRVKSMNNKQFLEYVQVDNEILAIMNIQCKIQYLITLYVTIIIKFCQAINAKFQNARSARLYLNSYTRLYISFQIIQQLNIYQSIYFQIFQNIYIDELFQCSEFIHLIYSQKLACLIKTDKDVIYQQK
ncbi:unnamed protein product [Paramecium sonneborni]|uniref:Uncharacterized protein n=1 Tax=Paramecium sonneborni TaxID=65129 RepID=A0A8S1MAA0_9CILI|nr:unnamed protein product [Paramecium sonneborni]